ncbi:type II toxin-antitoxin system PemK/MazF family toxin [Thiomicrospira sp. ALE5]|uniref:type II toxin-antitoxin system PemK/MazF family toxin n=1 Tax=Thiomicrospira sp. ALE5 TaxID=748650 RepID=UPI0008E69E57|nr:type II toxin-antitoxin system PemK/MazF family toxin [Thiomicrospira sp. ALE5]SFR56272.1 mRNA interferase MazF [Thiomicrospira sp. ALE5]
MRGDLVTIAPTGDYGKPRPAVIIQSDLFSEHPSIVLLPLTSAVRQNVSHFRINVEPTEKNGLTKPSQIMVDKPYTASAEKIGRKFGQIEASKLKEIDRTLAVFLGIA